MPTLRDIAKAANVSYSQASFVLNGRNLHLVSRERQQRIRQCMRELNYRPNRQARQIRQGRTNTLGLLVSSESHKGTTIAQQINGATQAAQEVGYCFSMLRLSDSEIEEGALPAWVREISLDCLILHYNHDMPDHIRDAIAQVRLPVIWINDRLAADCVCVDEVEAGRLATRTLLAQGHRRIAYVHAALPDQAWEALHHSCRDRLLGFEQVMGEAGLAPHRLMVHLPLYDQVQGLAEGILAMPEPPTAFIVATEPQAPGLRLLVQNLGLRGLEGQAAEVMTFVCILHPHEMVWNQMQVVMIPQAEMGAMAVRQSLRKIENPEQALEPAVLAPRDVFSWRESDALHRRLVVQDRMDILRAELAGMAPMG